MKTNQKSEKVKTGMCVEGGIRGLKPVHIRRKLVAALAVAVFHIQSFD